MNFVMENHFLILTERVIFTVLAETDFFVAAIFDLLEELYDDSSKLFLYLLIVWLS